MLPGMSGAPIGPILAHPADHRHRRSRGRGWSRPCLRLPNPGKRRRRQSVSSADASDAIATSRWAIAVAEAPRCPLPNGRRTALVECKHCSIARETWCRGCSWESSAARYAGETSFLMAERKGARARDAACRTRIKTCGALGCKAKRPRHPRLRLPMPIMRR